MGLMFLVGYGGVVVSAVYLLLIRPKAKEKYNETFIPLSAGLFVAGMSYIIIALILGDPYDYLLWLLGLLIVPIFTIFFRDFRSYLQKGSEVREYYSSLKGSKPKEEFKFEEREMRKKIKENCPIFEKKSD